MTGRRASTKGEEVSTSDSQNDETPDLPNEYEQMRDAIKARNEEFFRRTVQEAADEL